MNLKRNNIKSGLLVDLDGTLLKEHDVISEAVSTDLRRLNKILPISIVSGRGPSDVLKFSKSLDLKGPQYCENGSRIIDGFTGSLISEKLIPYYSASYIYGVIKKSRAGCILVANGETQKDPLGISSKISSLLAYSKIEGELTVVEKTLEDHQGVISIKSSDENGYFFLNYHRKDSGKHTAVDHFCNFYRILPEDIFAIGDGMNDLLMLRKCGHSIAMGNASNLVKNEATFVTDTIENDGVSKSINDYILPNFL